MLLSSLPDISTRTVVVSSMRTLVTVRIWLVRHRGDGGIRIHYEIESSVLKYCCITRVFARIHPQSDVMSSLDLVGDDE